MYKITFFLLHRYCFILSIVFDVSNHCFDEFVNKHHYLKITILFSVREMQPIKIQMTETLRLSIVFLSLLLSNPMNSLPSIKLFKRMTLWQRVIHLCFTRDFRLAAVCCNLMQNQHFLYGRNVT